MPVTLPSLVEREGYVGEVEVEVYAATQVLANGSRVLEQARLGFGRDQKRELDLSQNYIRIPRLEPRLGSGGRPVTA